MTINLNTAAKIGVGICIAGMAVRYLGRSRPVTVLGFTVMGQALAWMPNFVNRCLHLLKRPSTPLLLSSLPNDIAVTSTQQQGYNPYGAAIARIEDKGRDEKSITWQEIRELRLSTPPSLSSMPNDILLNIQKYLGEPSSSTLAVTSKHQLQAYKPYWAAVARIEDKGRDGKPITFEEIKELIETEQGLPFIRSLPFKLDLSNSYITDTDLQDIVLHFSGIIEINATNCHTLTDAGLQQHLAKLTNLEKLHLTECHQITDAGLYYLAKLINLKKLNLTECRQITDAGLYYLAKLTNLEKLDLTGCRQITDAGLPHLADLTNLEKLDLTDCQITSVGCTSLAHLPHLTITC